MENIWSELRDDFEDNGFIHIDAWETEDDNEEGKTIAKINTTTGEVTYIDERAKTNELAQRAISHNVRKIGIMRDREDIIGSYGLLVRR